MDQPLFQDLARYDEPEMKVGCLDHQKTRPAISKYKITPSVPISKHPFIRGKGCLQIGTKGVNC
jgi:hypothetical protein